MGKEEVARVYNDRKISYAARLEKLLANNAKVRPDRVQSPFPPKDHVRMTGRTKAAATPGTKAGAAQKVAQTRESDPSVPSLCELANRRADGPSHRRGMDRHRASDGGRAVTRRGPRTRRFW